MFSEREWQSLYFYRVFFRQRWQVSNWRQWRRMDFIRWMYATGRLQS